MALDSVMVTLDNVKKTSKNGIEYWMGKEIQTLLGYATWENFLKVIQKAQMACESAGEKSINHFRETTKMVPIGSGAMREDPDFFLSRYGCYLVAMNGDSKKPEIATAQTYFAVQTRRQEITDKAIEGDIDKRIELRERVKDATKHLVSAAKNAGVQEYALFHDAGYRGLYGMGLKDIKSRKSIPEKESLLDRVGRTELAANEFRITQTEEAIVRENIKGELAARSKHHKVAQEVRKTIKKLGGKMPEDLPAEPSIKKLASKGGKRIESKNQIAESN